MDFETEQTLRNKAHVLRLNGVRGWHLGLRAAGLDPHRLSSDVAHRAAPLAPSSYDPSDNSFECIWTTGVGVLRVNWDGPFNEVLDVTPKAVRLARLNAGAPLLNSHQAGDLGSILGAVVPGSARIVNGKGVCRLALSNTGDNEGLVANIKAGVIRNVSVGYMIHASTWTDATTTDVATCRITDWEPIEISAVAIPADPGAQIRRW